MASGQSRAGPFDRDDNAGAPSPARLPATDVPGPDRSVSGNPLVTKIRCFADIGSAETQALEAFARTPRAFSAEHILVHDGEAPRSVPLILQGFAYRYKLLSDGRRQILAYLMPGDFCEVESMPQFAPDYYVALLCDSLVVMTPPEVISELSSSFPRIRAAFRSATLREHAISREWLLNIGQRSAAQRISHFFCEMAWRLRELNLTNHDGSFALPVNQTALADTTGLTTVHVNRTLQRLRTQGLIEFSQRRLRILEPEKLAALAGFDDKYLRMRPSGL